MKKFALPSLMLILFISNISCNFSLKEEQVPSISFDENWRFIKDNPEGAENPAFDDSGWRSLDLPHDWSIEDLPNQSDSVIGPFSKASIGKMGTGYTIGGTAWYRKTFTIAETDADKMAYLTFDGIYMNSDVWINGTHVGNHPYGYTSINYDITPFLNPIGQPNVVAVQVKNEGMNARWYSGSGIYRHTWLRLVNPVHIAPWGVHVTTPDITEGKATIEVETKVLNTRAANSKLTYIVNILDPSGVEVANERIESRISSGKTEDLKQVIVIENPMLWSIETPDLYKAQVEILLNNTVTDKLSTTFGIRTIEIDAQNGFRLNGKTVLLKGGCYHHDNGPLGSKAIDRAEERKMELFKNAGLNAIRCSHNPPSPYLLDVCDRLGILVIDEIFDNWEKPKVSEDDYSKYFKEWWQKDLESMVVRDRNHPSVVMWSIGNEIPEATDSSGLKIVKNLVAEVRRLDSKRGVTEALVDISTIMGQPSKWDESAEHHAQLDVVGYNYMYSIYAKDHAKYPERVMMATEFMPLFSLANWKAVEEYPYVIGNFAWVVMDYLGEAGVGLSRYVPDVPASPMGNMGLLFARDSWPIFNDYQGDIDLIGNFKPRYSYQSVVWRKSNIAIMVHEPIPAGMKEFVSPWGWPEELKCWNWEGHEGDSMQVNVYTRSPLVKLELNGDIIGEQAVDGDTSITATFEVPYEPGTLIARSYDANGVETGSDIIKTVGKPAAVRLIADRVNINADRNDLSYVMAEVVDSVGNVIPNASDIMVNFSISGKGEIAGVGSGSPTDLSSFQQPRKKVWHGKCLAIVRPTGNEAGVITLSATAEGLQGSTIAIATQ